MNAQTRAWAPHGDRSKLHTKEVQGIGDGVGANVAAESFKTHRYLIVCLRARTQKKLYVRVCICVHPRSNCQQQVALSVCSSWCSRRVLVHPMRSVAVINARFVTTKNPTVKTLTKVTMSMKTAMTTVQHRVLEDRFDMLSFFHCTDYWHSRCASVFSVAASSLAGLYDLVSVFVVSPFCGSSHVLPTIMCYSVKFFHVGLRLSLFVHEHLVLFVLEVAPHDLSVIVLHCGTQVISRSLEFL